MDHVAQLHGYDIEPGAANATIKGNTFEKHLLKNNEAELDRVLGSHEQRYTDIKTLAPSATVQEKSQHSHNWNTQMDFVQTMKHHNRMFHL